MNIHKKNWDHLSFDDIRDYLNKAVSSDITDEYEYEAIEQIDYKGIAEDLMNELVANGIESKILLANDKISKWWGAHQAQLAKAEAKMKAKAEAQALIEEDNRDRESLIARLSSNEKRLLGIKDV